MRAGSSQWETTVPVLFEPGLVAIARNHLAIETPEPNLSEGMRYLQSGFAMHFKKRRKENGRLLFAILPGGRPHDQPLSRGFAIYALARSVQGRLRSIQMEGGDRLGWLCHYIRLNPIRAGICDVSALGGYRFGSYPCCSPPSLARASSIRCPAWRRITGHAVWPEEVCSVSRLAIPRRAQSEGNGLRSDEQGLGASELGATGRREARELGWDREQERGLRALRIDQAEASSSPKWADWKVAVAAWLKSRRLASNGWLARQLAMGDPFGASRSPAKRGTR